jgi:ribA/ribD-fused uncharacterized protein
MLMPPLWIRYPNLSDLSNFWLSGEPKAYKGEFYKWLNKLSSKEYEEYQAMFPAPKTWGNYYDDDRPPDPWCENIRLWSEEGEMRYSRKKLSKMRDANKKLKFIFFWMPQNNVLDKSCLSQWQSSIFAVDGEVFICAEQYMMSEKARLFGDDKTREKIMSASHPKEMKNLGRQIVGFNSVLWDKAKYSIVLNGNYYKFSQHKDMRDFLLQTGDKILVEASMYDTIWGIGLGEDDQNAVNPKEWRGENLLGFALMEVRDELRAVYKNYDKLGLKS